MDGFSKGSTYVIKHGTFGNKKLHCFKSAVVATSGICSDLVSKAIALPSRIEVAKVCVLRYSLSFVVVLFMFSFV